jgi:hypothetical protein
MMKALRMLAIAMTLFIAQGVHAQDYTPNPAATPSEKKEPRKPAHIYPTVSQAEVEARYPEELKAQRRAEAAIAANAWVLKVPHVKGMMPKWIMDQNVPRDEAIEKGIGETGIRVWVDEPENVREVEGQVPSQLSGVPVVVEANPTNFILE